MWHCFYGMEGWTCHSVPLPFPTWFNKVCGGIFLHCFLKTVNFVVILTVLSLRYSYVHFPWLTRWTCPGLYSLSKRALTVDNEEDTSSLRDKLWNGENCIMKSFMFCILQTALLGWSYRGWWDGQSMWHITWEMINACSILMGKET